MLSQKQMEVLLIAEKQRITRKTIETIFASKSHADSVFNFMVRNGFLELDGLDYGYFRITKKGIEEINKFTYKW